MKTELCRVTTADGLQLDGSLRVPDSLAPDFAAFLLVHGTGSNFYAPGILESFARLASQQGHCTLRINTRGHDLQCSIPSSGRAVTGGACCENIADCVLDIDAWIQFLFRRGCSRIVLVGHSMGGVKSVYSQVKAPAPQAAAIVCLSPPRFCHQHWMHHPRADAFREAVAEAQQLIQGGLGHQLIQARQPLPLTVSAEGFLAKYGQHDEYDLAKLCGDAPAPVLILVGEKTITTSPAFDSWPAVFANPPDRVAFHIVAGADMSYSNNPEEPFEQVLGWLAANGAS